MPTKAVPPTDRPPLSRERIVDAALGLADREGVEAVSFRRLAGAFGVTPMALYRYVASKDELIAAMMDRVFADFALPAVSTGEWQEELRAFGRAFRQLLLSHPAAAPLYFNSSDSLYPNGLQIVEALLAVLAQAGFTGSEAALLQGSLERQVLALVLFETRAAAVGTPEELADRVRAQRARLLTLPPERFPRILSGVDAFCGAVDPEEQFESSLDLIVAGLERLGERRTADPG